MTWYHPNGRVYDITPVPAPRQTRSEVWKPRPGTLRYRAFRDECRLKKMFFKSGDFITFYLPIPKSWSEKKKNQKRGTSHQQKPDLDNLFKALSDAVYEKDEHIAEISLRKLWSEKGLIEVSQKGFWL